MLKQLLQDEKGFTLLEMLVVLFVIGLLLLVIIPNISQHQDSAQNKGDLAFASTLQTQVDLYRMDTKQTPTSFEALRGDYLTDEQASKAAESYSIVNGKVQGP